MRPLRPESGEELCGTPMRGHIATSLYKDVTFTQPSLRLHREREVGLSIDLFTGSGPSVHDFVGTADMPISPIYMRNRLERLSNVECVAITWPSPN